MRFSIVIDNYNTREYIAEAVDSALQQTVPPHEVVVVDDGSTDGSAEFLKARYADHPAVKLVFKENGGQLSAIAAGVQAATGDVVVLLDGDDLYEPQYLERLTREYAERPDVDFVCVNMRRFGAAEGLWFDAARDADWGTSALKVWSTQVYEGAPTSGNSLRRDLCAKALSVPDEMAEEWRTHGDDCVVIGAAIWGAHKSYIAEPLVRYRVHDRNRWLGRTLPRVGQAQHALRTARMVEWHADRAGLTPRALYFAHLEFKTRGRPSLSELALYISLSNRAAAPFTHKLWALLSMIRHYALCFVR